MLCKTVLSITRSVLQFVIKLGASVAKTSTETKTPLENKHLGNGDYIVIITSSSHSLLLIEHTANELVEAPLK